MTLSISKGISAKDKWFVGIQLILLFGYVFDFCKLTYALPYWSIYLGLLIAVSGVLEGLIAVYQLRKHLTPYPTPLPGAQLIQTGIYHYFRHPIYGGIIAFAIGYALFSQSLSRGLIATALLILFWLKSIYEEKQLQKKFTEYLSYKKRTFRFLPFI